MIKRICKDFKKIPIYPSRLKDLVNFIAYIAFTAYFNDGQSRLATPSNVANATLLLP